MNFDHCLYSLVLCNNKQNSIYRTSSHLQRVFCYGKMRPNKHSVAKIPNSVSNIEVQINIADTVECNVFRHYYQLNKFAVLNYRWLDIISLRYYLFLIEINLFYVFPSAIRLFKILNYSKFILNK